MTHCLTRPHVCSRRGTAAGRGRRADRPGTARLGEGLGADAPWKPEKGAKLSMLRWKYFVQSEDDAFVKLIDAFTKATGVKVHDLARILRGRAAEGLGRRQYRHRARTCSGASIRCRICSRRSAWTSPTSPTISARNTAAGSTSAVKYGKQRQQVDRASRSLLPATMINYRIEASKKAGFEKFPDKTDGFLEYAKAMKKNNTPGGFALGHASGDGNGWVHWACGRTAATSSTRTTR